MRVLIFFVASILGSSSLWSIREVRRLSNVVIDLRGAQTFQHDVSLPPLLLKAMTSENRNPLQDLENTKVVLVGSSKSPLTAESIQSWEQFLIALGKVDLTIITFDRKDIFEKLIRARTRIGQEPHLLTITDQVAFSLNTGISTVPFTIVAKSPNKIVGLFEGKPTEAVLNQMIYQLNGDQHIVVGTGPGDKP